jgi:hypothetical protein
LFSGLAEQVEGLEVACHRLLKNPADPTCRAALLEALATYKAQPTRTVDFGEHVYDLVAASRVQADILCAEILEARDPGNSSDVEDELRRLCGMLAELGDALSGVTGRSA